MEDGYAHVDIANQINNSWNKDFVLAIREGNVSFSVKIKTIDKKYLRKRFKRFNNPPLSSQSTSSSIDDEEA